MATKAVAIVSPYIGVPMDPAVQKMLTMREAIYHATNSKSATHHLKGVGLRSVPVSGGLMTIAAVIDYTDPDGKDGTLTFAPELIPHIIKGLDAVSTGVAKLKASDAFAGSVGYDKATNAIEIDWK